MRWLLLLFVVGTALAAGWLYRDFERFADAPLPIASPLSFEVAKGTSLPGIVRDLREHGVRTGPGLYWRLLARRMDVAGKLHAGEYSLVAGTTPRALLTQLAGGNVIQHRFTIVDGWTFAQLRQALGSNEELRHTLPDRSDAQVMDALGLAKASPEGWFLPETYQFVQDMSDMDILRRAHAAMRATLDKLWAARAAAVPLKTPYEALILASIVEKETGRADERALIAGVFENRLKLGMRLQTDPTVIYGMGAAYAGNIRKRDLEADTPYNTYTRAGLPPTPIAMPSAASLAAVMHPAQTRALYFVARGDGSHEFSDTLQAHNRAVAKYQLHRNP
jgi:UPF0755 protein